jgi:hypothetical protein
MVVVRGQKKGAAPAESSDGRCGRTAEDDVSIHTTSKKQESRECGEKRRMMKGRKRRRKESGGETHPYPARKRRTRTCCDGKGQSDRIAVGAFEFPERIEAERFCDKT